MKKILFVCLGNICRSPLAEGAFRALAEEAGLAVLCDSAGTASYHTGELPDPRARRVAEKNGITLKHRGRQLIADDFATFDYILVMDSSNYNGAQRLAAKATVNRAKVALLRHFDPQVKQPTDVEDPYYGNDAAFDECFAVVSRCCRQMVNQLRETGELAL